MLSEFTFVTSQQNNYKNSDTKQIIMKIAKENDKVKVHYTGTLSDGEIFDPIATQLRGNMVCTTDEKRQMLGLFEVASKIITPAFVNYTPEGDRYLGKRIEISKPFPDNGWKDTIPPDFWVEKVFPNQNQEQLLIGNHELMN